MTHQNRSIWLSNQEDAQQLTHPDLRGLYDYWHDKCAGRRAPTRADIDPLDFPKLLPWINIFKVLRQENSQDLDYQNTLFGTKLVLFVGHDYTGKNFSDIFKGDAASAVKAIYDRVAQTGEVCYSNFDAAWMNKDYVNYERLLLPLSDDGVTIDRLIGCTIFYR